MNLGLGKNLDLEGLEAMKAEANGLFSKSDYKMALKLYFDILKNFIKLDSTDIDVEFIKNEVKSCVIKPTHPDLKKLLSTVTFNMALCFNRMEKKHDAKMLFETALIFDEDNYKANYNLAHLYLLDKDYKMALVYIEMCQKIVKNGLSDWKNKNQPHLDLMEQVKKILNGNDVSIPSENDPSRIVNELYDEENVHLNLQRLRQMPVAILIQSESVCELVKFCIKKLDNVTIDETLVSVWSLLYHVLNKCQDKYKNELYSQFMLSFKTNESSLYDYVNNVLNVYKTGLKPKVVLVLSSVAKCCSLVKGVDVLKVLLLLLETDWLDLSVILSSVIVYFSNCRSCETKKKDSSFNVVLSKLLQKLIGMCEEDSMVEEDQLELCLMSIFRMEFEGYEVAQDSFSNMINMALEPHIKNEYDPVSGGHLLSFEHNWYVAMKCLFMSNKSLFKAHMVIACAVKHLVRVYFTDYSERERRLSFETLLNCVDFVEFRQEILDFEHNDKSFLDLMNSPELVKFSNELVAHDALDLNLKSPEDCVEDECGNKRKEFSRWMVESAVLMYSKLSIHSPRVKDEVLSYFNLFNLLPKMALCAPKRGLDQQLLLQSLMFATLHEEFKRADLSFLPKLLCDYEESDLSTLLVVQIISNLLRGNKDKNSFVEDLELVKYDANQIKQLRMLQEKLPEQAKLTVNGNYFEGSDESANIARSELFSISNHSVPIYLVRTHKSVSSEIAKLLVVEALHYLALNVNHRRCLQSLGVMRILINVANSSKYRQLDNSIAKSYRSMSCYKLVVQSIAHLCIATAPSNLAYNDAQDSLQPLMNLVEDDNELFQYEAALALTNLLSINDEVRRRAYSLGAWDKFSNLLFSDNEMLQTAALEGWCNLCAGDDVVHSQFYLKIKTQVESAPEGSLYEVNVHDINIMLMFIADNIKKNTVSAASGALALLVRDGRIAQYMPFVSRFENVLKTLDGTDDASIIHRLLTVLSCVVQSRLPHLDEVNEAHVNSVIKNVRSAARRNSHKYSNKKLLDLFDEIC